VGTADSTSAVAWPRRPIVTAVILTTVGGFAAWLATDWALSQASAVFSAGRTTEGWILALRPVALPLGMVIAWLVSRSTVSEWSRLMRVLGAGVFISVALLFFDGIMSGGF
jgi:hypothetical protein